MSRSLATKLKPRIINANLLITCPGSNEFVYFPQDKDTANWKNRIKIDPVKHSCMTEIHDAVDIGEMNDNSFCGKWMCSAYDLSYSGELFTTFVKRETRLTIAAIWSFVDDVIKHFNRNDDDLVILTFTGLAFSRGVPTLYHIINCFNDEAERKNIKSFNWLWRLSFLDPVLSGMFDAWIPWYRWIYLKPLEYVDKCVIQQQIGEKRRYMDLMVIKIHPAFSQPEFKKIPHMHSAFLRTFIDQLDGISIQAFTLRDLINDFIKEHFRLKNCPRFVVDLHPTSLSHQKSNNPMHEFGTYKRGFFKVLSISSKRKILDQTCGIILKHLSGVYEEEYRKYLNHPYQWLLRERPVSQNAFHKSAFFMDNRTLQYFQICYPETYKFMSDTSITSDLEKWSYNTSLIHELKHMKKDCSNLFKLLFENNAIPFNQAKYHDLMSKATVRTMMTSQDEAVSTTGLILSKL